MKSCGPFSASTDAHWAIVHAPEMLLALDHVHRLDQLWRPGGVADPPAGHRIGLGDAVHRQRARLQAGSI